jgi:hypothetical protein
MTGSTWHGGWPFLVCAVAVGSLLASPAMAAPDKKPAMAAPDKKPALAAPDKNPSLAAPETAPVESGSPAADPAAPPSATPAAPPAAASRPPDPTEGDRTALIVQDMAQHPPQAQIPSQDPAHLQTAKMKLGGLLDRSVRGTENSEVGRVIDVLTGDDGKPAALELDVGGFMGVGNRKIAVAWSLFDLSRTDSNDPLRVALSEAQVRSAPAAEASGPVAVVTGAAPVVAARQAAPASMAAPPMATVPAPAQPPAPPPASDPATAPAAAPAASPEGHGKHQPGQPATPPDRATPGARAGRSAPGGGAGSDGRF